MGVAAGGRAGACEPGAPDRRRPGGRGRAVHRLGGCSPGALPPAQRQLCPCSAEWIFSGARRRPAAGLCRAAGNRCRRAGFRCGHPRRGLHAASPGGSIAPPRRRSRRARKAARRGPCVQHGDQFRKGREDFGRHPSSARRRNFGRPLMCGIAGVADLRGEAVPALDRTLAAMGRLIAHRGPDGAGSWTAPDSSVGLVHRRLAIIDLSESGAQPMTAAHGTVISYNGEIYNYRELRDALAGHWNFQSQSDTETILAAYEADGSDCLSRLRGMFAFALWDQRRGRLFCARDRFGVKPFYYAVIDGRFHFASEAKALLPFLSQVATDPQALAEYLTFQYTIGEHTLFRSIKQLLPGHALLIENGAIRTWRYWDVNYQVDFDHS